MRLQRLGLQPHGGGQNVRLSMLSPWALAEAILPATMERKEQAKNEKSCRMPPSPESARRRASVQHPIEVEEIYSARNTGHSFYGSPSSLVTLVGASSPAFGPRLATQSPHQPFDRVSHPEESGRINDSPPMSHSLLLIASILRQV